MRESLRNNISVAANQRLLIFLPVIVVAICLLGVGIYVDRLNLHAEMQELKHCLVTQVSAVRARL